MKKYLAIAVIAVFSFSNIKAQDSDSSIVVSQDEPSLSSLPTDRPGATYNAQTLGQGFWQLQMAVNWGEFYNVERKRDFNVTSLPLDVRYGITDKLEVMISPVFSFATIPGSGAGIEYTLGNIAGSLRYSLFENKPAGNLGLMGTYEYVSYEGGIESANLYRLKILYSLPIGKLLTLSSNVGYLYDVEADASFVQYTLNTSFAIFPKFGFYIEIYGDIILSEMEGSDNPFYFDAGIYYLSNPDFQIDAGYNRGGNSQFIDDFAFVGLSYRFGGK